MLLYPYKENREKPQYFRDLGEKKVCGNNITSHIFFSGTYQVGLTVAKAFVCSCVWLSVRVYVCVLLNMCVWLSLSDLLVFTCFHSILLGFTSIFHCLFLVLLFFSS